MLSVVKALKQVGDASVRPSDRVREDVNREHTKYDHTIATCVFLHIQFFKKALHERSGDRRASNNARAKIGGIKVGRLRDAEDSLEHCRHAV